MRKWRIQGSYKIEQRKGFIVTHSINSLFDTAGECSNGGQLFLKDYNSKHCYCLELHVDEVYINE